MVVMVLNILLAIKNTLIAVEALSTPPDNGSINPEAPDLLK